MIYTTLVTAMQLRSSLDAGTPLVIVDTGFDLADTAAGERSHRESRLPGAFYLHLDRDLSAPMTGRNGRHPLPAREAFAATAGRLGIRPATQVVVYDRQGGMIAVRLWWMLRWIGHAAVAVLDGGFAAWQAEGGAVETGEPAALPVQGSGAAPYPLGASLVATVDADALAGELGRRPLIDARAPERFRGEVEPLDAQAGHIPGALNRFFKDNLQPDGRFKPYGELRRAFEPLLGGAPADAAIHHCGSGVTACHNLFAMEVAGLTGSALYPGSWSEWSSDPARPVARG